MIKNLLLLILLCLTLTSCYKKQTPTDYAAQKISEIESYSSKDVEENIRVEVGSITLAKKIAKNHGGISSDFQEEEKMLGGFAKNSEYTKSKSSLRAALKNKFVHLELMRDPFMVFVKNQKVDMLMNKESLTRYAIDDIKVVGIIKQNNIRYLLVQLPDGMVYKLSRDEALGLERIKLKAIHDHSYIVQQKNKHGDYVDVTKYLSP